MYLYDRKLSRVQSKKQPITARPAERNAYYPARIVSEFWGRGGTNGRDLWAHEGLGQLTTEELSKKLTHLALLPHFVEVNGKDVPLTPGAMDPGIYDGREKYKINDKLQGCLKEVMKKNEFRHIRVALVDLTKSFNQPEFAASFDHTKQVFVASVAKIAAMLAAFQLRHDLRAVLKQKGAKTLAELFDLVRADWAGTQRDPGGRATLFSPGVSLRGKLVLMNGNKIPLGDGKPKAPRLGVVFANVKAGNPVTIEFTSTGENKAKLKTIINEFNQASEDLDKALNKLKEEEKKKGNAMRVAEARRKHKERLQKFNQEKAKIDALGFLERMRVTIGGLVPASNFAMSTIVRDVGYLYIASTLLQSGLYDTHRNGGLWLGADYWEQSNTWMGPLGGGSAQSATAGSLAAFMTLLVRRRLVSREASVGMGRLMKKAPNPTHPITFSPFKRGLKQLPNKGSLKTVLSKLGFHKGVDDCAYIEREVDCGKDRKGKKWELPHRYVAVGLRAKSETELEKLILELDKCILASNRKTPCVIA